MEESLSYKANPTDIMPASVMAAVSCDNYYRALRLLETYTIKKDHKGIPKYNRQVISLVQTLYFNLGETENNEGAFSLILKNDKPTDQQTIMSACAQGGQHEILPMIYEKNRVS